MKNHSILFTIGIYFSLIAGSVCHGIFTSAPINEIFTDVIISFLLSYILNHYVKYIQSHRDRSIQNERLFLILFFIANMLFVVANQEFYGYLWLLPVVMVAIGSGAEQAIVVFAALSAQNVLLHSDVFSARELLVVAIYGFVCIWIMIQQLSGKILPYVGIIMLAVDGVLQILRYRFSLSAIRIDKLYIALEAGSVALLFVFACVYVRYRNKNYAEAYDEEEYVEESDDEEAIDEETTVEETIDEEANVGEAIVEETTTEETENNLPDSDDLYSRLTDILQADYSLFLRLQEYSAQLFVHSMRISSVSAQAARYMGGNVQLAQAGGLYHEIGRITREKDYVAAGIKLTEENDFPEDLTAVIRQHSLKYEKPQSLEAVIVMFTDNIISTDEYLKRSGKRGAVSDDKLVDMIFKDRISKGNLSESGMSDEDIEKLRMFYIKQYYMSDEKAKDA
ncbi:MAG: HD domain-containing protein [Lachnospiraceae bacterium]|nr:HD domain-containing protein [Lachnospiraceae bacterium]